MRSIINILSNDATIQGLVGTKVFAIEATQGAEMPYLIVDIEDSTPSYTKDATSDLDILDVRVLSVAEYLYTGADNVVGADDLSKAVRAAIDQVAPGVYDGENLKLCNYQNGLNYSTRITNKEQRVVEQNYLLSIEP